MLVDADQTFQSLTVAELPYGERTVARLLRHQARHRPGAHWLTIGEDSYTFAEADALVDQYVAGLVDTGFTHESRLGIVSENSLHVLALALAASRVGAVLVPINTANRGESLRHVIEKSQVDLLFADAKGFDRVAELLNEDDCRLGVVRALVLDVLDGARTSGSYPLATYVIADLLAAAGAVDGALISHTVDTESIWTIMFTSGTTGPPKGAMMSHQYSYSVPRNLCFNRDLRQDDVFYVCSPLFHAAAWLVQVIPSLFLALPVVIDTGFTVSGFWDRIRKYGATQLLTMGATHMWLWNAPPTPSDLDNPARVWAPVPIPAEIAEAFKERFGVQHLWQTYGGTEFMSVTMTNVLDPSKPGSSGKSRPGVLLSVQDEHGFELPPGEVGELCVRPTAPHSIFEGYFDEPEKTLERFRNLWYHTGDLVRLDQDGELFFIDRKDDYLRVHGENVSSFAVEAAFMAHPAVVEAVAHGVRDAVASAVAEDEIKVCVVLQENHEGVEEAAILEAASRDLPKFAVPRYVEIVTDLPRTATGRVKKGILRERGVTPATWERPARN